MPASPLFEIPELDFDAPAVSRRGLEDYNPHRGEMALLDGVLWDDRPAFDRAIAYHTAHADAFWVPGHIPGSPIMPGVLMVEAGAQLASYLYYAKSKATWFAGFARIEETVFRGQVVPGDTLLLLCEGIRYQPKRFITRVQGLVSGSIVFESTITGLAFPKVPKHAAHSSASTT